MVLEYRRSLEIDHAHERQLRFGRTAAHPAAEADGGDAARFKPGPTCDPAYPGCTPVYPGYSPVYQGCCNPAFVPGSDVSQLMLGRSFHAHKPPLDKAQLAAKRRARAEPRINGNYLDPDRFDHTLRYGSWSEEQRVGLMRQGQGRVDCRG